MADQDHSAQTLLVHAGNHPEDNHGIINPPVYHACSASSSYAMRRSTARSSSPATPILPVRPELSRTATPWAAGGPVLRLHAGLEAIDDLIADLGAGLARLAAAG